MPAKFLIYMILLTCSICQNVEYPIYIVFFVQQITENIVRSQLSCSSNTFTIVLIKVGHVTSITRGSFTAESQYLKICSRNRNTSSKFQDFCFQLRKNVEILSILQSRLFLFCFVLLLSLIMCLLSELFRRKD